MELKIYKHDAAHMTKVAATPILVKALQKSSLPGPVFRFPSILVKYSILDIGLS